MERNLFRFEVCANGVESCLAAQAGGADRVELCAGIPEGGTTPSYGEIMVARRVLTTTRLHVIIRPRGGDFLYTPLELERMEADIEVARQLGADGVVIGCLHEDGTIDMESNRRLVEKAQGMSLTFHRAFDRCRDSFEALEQLIDLGFDRILTSGQQPKAIEGAPLLQKLHQQAAGLWRERAEHTQPLRTDGHQGISLLCPRADEKQNGIQQSRGLHGRPQRRRRHLALHDGGAGTRHYRPTNRREIARRDIQPSHFESTTVSLRNSKRVSTPPTTRGLTPSFGPKSVFY